MSPAPWKRHRGPALVGVVLLLTASAVAASVSVPAAGYGIKSDEATYVAAALSAGYDRDLRFDRRDLERFAALYHSGPEGIFLKRGRALRVRMDGHLPFIHVARQYDPSLYFGKALLYPVLAAPFVRVFGLNGMLLLNVLFVAVIATLGYVFLATQGSATAATLLTAAFLGASVFPAYSVFLMPEVFNCALVFVAYFLWLFKEIQPIGRWSGRWTDAVAAVLLGFATYSKPVPIGLFVAPLVVLQFWRRRAIWGLTLGTIAVTAAATCFAWTAAVTGEFNYQSGDRRTFHNRFPFDSPDAAFDRGALMQTDGDAVQQVLTSSDAATWFAHNIVYSVLGRHFGIVPYFFPGVVAILAWLLSPARRDRWRILTFAAFAASVPILLLLLPFTWSGGGGPPGNRYLFAVYPELLFLIPPTAGVATGVIAWLGGALFTAQILANPFVAAKNTWVLTEKGPPRWLPVELTMANDLPVMLAQPSRGRVHYGPYDENGFLLYYLDGNSWPPEPDGMWVSANGRTEIIVRTVKPIDRLAIEMKSPIATTVTVAIGGPSATVRLQPNKVESIELSARGVRGLRSYAYLMKARSTNGFVPHLLDAHSADYRYLGAQLRFAMRP